jgi:hypothetical protein
MHPRRRSGTLHLYLETLESRQLLSGQPFMPANGLLPTAVVQTAPSSVSPFVMTGVPINAISTQGFRAVVGTINFDALPVNYTLRGSINWGDNSASSDASFVRQTNGTIAVMGEHIYTVPGTDVIKVQVIAVPPDGTLPPVRLLGSIQTKATVALPNGGFTLNATITVPFTANLGIFRTTVPVENLTAIINWGDGTQSVGKIVALPTADPLAAGAFAVVGGHTYSSLGSYQLHVSVISSSPTPVASTAVNLVASFDSVVDVLPLLPTVTA